MADSKVPKHICDRVNDTGAVIAGLAMLLMAVIGFADVFMSQALNSPIPGTFELTETLMVVAAFMAFSRNQQFKGNIRVELLTSLLKKSTQAKLKVFTDSVTFIFFSLLSWQAWVFSISSLKVLEYESGLIAFPIYPAKLMLAIGATMIAVQSLRDLLHSVRSQAGITTNTREEI